MAVVDTAKGAVQAYSNAQELGPIAGPIVGALQAGSGGGCTDTKNPFYFL